MKKLGPRPHVLITGGAGGIGRALARSLLARTPGAQLTLADVDVAAAASVARSLGAAHRAVAWDLRAPDGLPHAVRALEEEHGPVDVLVNCAGVMEIRSLVATGWALGETLLAIDLLSPMRLMDLLVPGMVARGRGVVVNVSSMAGVTPLRGCVYYGAAKAGLAMASEIARIELAPKGVSVVTVYPGPVRTPLESRARAQAPDSLLARRVPTGDPEVLAEAIAEACARGRARVVYPFFYRVAFRLPVLAGRITRALSPIPLDR